MKLLAYASLAMLLLSPLVHAQAPSYEYTPTHPTNKVRAEVETMLSDCIAAGGVDCETKIYLLGEPETEVVYEPLAEGESFEDVDVNLLVPLKKKSSAAEITTVFGGTIERGAYCPTKWLYVKGDYYKFTRENMVNGEIELGWNLKQGSGSEQSESRLGLAYVRKLDGTQTFGVRISQKGVLNIFKIR